MIENAEFYVSYSEAGSSWSMTKTYDEDHTTWRELVHDFLRFLDGAYGYSVSSQVTVEGSKDLRQMDLFESYGGTE